MRPVRLLLASTSPRRQALLREAGIPFETCAPGAEYASGGEEPAFEAGEPRALAQQRAARKARGASVHDGAIPVLAVDTVVDLGGSELGKPRDRADAERLLGALAGRRHEVHTAHCLRIPASGREWHEVTSAVVVCRVPSSDELRSYLDSGDWRGKAGAYGIQDPTQRFLTVAAGDFDTVMGLHVAAVRRLLAAAEVTP